MLESLDTLIAFVLIMLLVSLLITIVVQMCSAAFNLRGRNLLSGLGSVIAVIDPALENQKKELAHYLLRGRLLSDSFLPRWLSWWRPTDAARPAEIFDALRRVAIGNEYKDPDHPTPEETSVADSAKKVLEALGLQVGTLPEALEKAKTLGDSVNNAIASIPDEALRNQAQAAMGQVTSKLSGFETTVVRIGSGIAGNIDAAYKKFDYYTCMSQERAQQWLTMHTRILTVILAVGAAFWLQLDTVEIFKLVSSNKAVRDKLVAQAGALEAQAAKVFGDSTTVLQTAVKNWSSKQTDPALKDALAKIDVKDTDTRDVVRQKVDVALKALNGQTPIDSFDDMVNETATNRLKSQAGDFDTIKADFEKTGFDLFPQTNRYRWGKRWCDGFRDHFTGMLFSVGLLSLGAPFWYGTLKNLVNLRSQVAQNISEDQKKKPADAQATPPPT